MARSGQTTAGQPPTLKYYYTRDHLGSVREVVDQGGQVMGRWDYDPWGVRTKLGGVAGFDVEWGFTGHHFHARSGLHLALYRAYDANLGRWLSADPIGEAGGLNLYGYVGNDPAWMTDPLGLADRSGDIVTGVISSYSPSASVADKMAAIISSIYADAQKSCPTKSAAKKKLDEDIADTFVSGGPTAPGNGPTDYRALNSGGKSPSGFKTGFIANQNEFGRHLGAAYRWPSAPHEAGDRLQALTAPNPARRAECNAEANMDHDFRELRRNLHRLLDSGAHRGAAYREAWRTFH